MDANKLSAHIFKLIKRKIETKKFQDIQFSVDPKTVVDINNTSIKNPLEIFVYLEFKAIANPKFYLMAAYSSLQNKLAYIRDPKSYRSTDRKVEVFIELSHNISEASYNSIYMNLVEQIRHELQHMVDDDKNIPMTTKSRQINVNKLQSPDPSISFPEYSEYVLGQMEQTAYIRGLMLQAKKTKTPIEMLLRDLLHQNLFRKAGGPKYEEELRKLYGDLVVNHRFELILKTLMDQAKKIFPNLDR